MNLVKKLTLKNNVLLAFIVKNKRAKMPEKAGCVGIKKAFDLKSRNKKLNRETAKKRTNNTVIQ